MAGESITVFFNQIDPKLENVKLPFVLINIGTFTWGYNDGHDQWAAYSNITIVCDGLLGEKRAREVETSIWRALKLPLTVDGIIIPASANPVSCTLFMACWERSDARTKDDDLLILRDFYKLGFPQNSYTIMPDTVIPIHYTRARERLFEQQKEEREQLKAKAQKRQEEKKRLKQEQRTYFLEHPEKRLLNRLLNWICNNS